MTFKTCIGNANPKTNEKIPSGLALSNIQKRGSIKKKVGNMPDYSLNLNYNIIEYNILKFGNKLYH